MPDSGDNIETLLRKIASSLAGNSNIPRWDSRTFTRIGSTNNISTIVYKLNGTTVATQTFTYFGNGASDNDTVSSESIAY